LRRSRSEPSSLLYWVFIPRMDCFSLVICKWCGDESAVLLANEPVVPVE
jgi:hypothetical protein